MGIMDMLATVLATQAGSSDGLTQIPVALDALKDWSQWLVSTQTAVIALAAFGLGSSKITGKWTKRFSVAGIFMFALSILCVSFALGAIPSILIRLEDIGNKYDTFYRMPISAAPWYEDTWFYDKLQMYLFTGGEFIFFIAGLLCFMVAAIGAIRQKPSSSDVAVAGQTPASAGTKDPTPTGGS